MNQIELIGSQYGAWNFAVYRVRQTLTECHLVYQNCQTSFLRRSNATPRNTVLQRFTHTNACEHGNDW